MIRFLSSLMLLLVGLALLSACSREQLAPVEYGSKPAKATESKKNIQVARARAPLKVEHSIRSDKLHKVSAGETVYAISRKYGVNLRGVIEANAMHPPYKVVVGQSILVPAPRFHKVKSGETLYGISRIYGLGVRELVQQNRLAEPYLILPGDELLLPYNFGPRKPAAPPPPVKPRMAQAAGGGALVPVPGIKPLSPGMQSAVKANQAEQNSATDPVFGSSSSRAAPRRAGKGFLWPVQGRIISGFGVKGGGRHNDGINIAAQRGLPVRAAENGVVAYAGNELRGFGNLLLVRHSGGWMTAYAHNEKLNVKAGQKVTRGQVIAQVGSSGKVESPQLHFEIRKGRRAYNPLRYLARRS